MKWFLIAGAALALAGCGSMDADIEAEARRDAEVRQQEVMRQVVEARARRAANAAAEKTPPDNSEISLLMGMAEQHRKLAKLYKAQLDVICRIDDEAAMQIHRDSGAAVNAWLDMKATDYARLERSACLNALGDVGSLAYGCTEAKYNTYAQAASERHYAVDIEQCDELIAHPPPLDASPND